LNGLMIASTFFIDLNSPSARGAAHGREPEHNPCQGRTATTKTEVSEFTPIFWAKF
jgi:hypothetical protein